MAPWPVSGTMASERVNDGTMASERVNDGTMRQ